MSSSGMLRRVAPVRTETSALTRVTRRNIPGDAILYSHRRENLKSKPEGKRPLGRPRRRWIDNIKMDLLEVGFSVVDWIGLAQDRYWWRALVNSVMNLRVP
jgi:hypothetical protein